MRRTLLLWLAAALALAFGLQRLGVAPALILALVLLVRLGREARTPTRAWLLAASAFAAAALAVVDNAYLHAPTGLRLAIDLGGSAVAALPFALHRALQPRLPAALAWLVLPAAQVLLEAGLASGPYGSWGALAYSFRDWGAVLQLAALGGTGLLAFAACAVAAGLETAWHLGLRARGGRGALAGVAGGCLLLGGWGAVRLRGVADGPFLPIAAVSLADRDYAALVEGRSMRALAQAGPGPRAQVAPGFAAAQGRLLDLSRRALEGGARVVVWPETVPTLEEQLPRLLQEAQTLAASHRAGLLLTPWVVRRSASHPYGENLALAVDAEGVRFRFAKAHPVPGVERNLRAGTRPPATWESPAGPAMAAICMDLDFPAYLRRVPQDRCLLFAPADDWPAVRDVHAAMHRLRAIELGVSLARAANNGVSELVDARGRVLARLDSRDGGLLLGRVPAGRISTIYARWGRWVEAASALLLLVLVLRARRVATP
ncbi:MAG: nitrilase-related carbon-nitrogen hydrolase [Holophagaceae bacterium]